MFFSGVSIGISDFYLFELTFRCFLLVVFSKCYLYVIVLFNGGRS